MLDRATPNLPSRDLTATSLFYAQLGFKETFKDDGGLILQRDTIQIEFFPWTPLDPKTNIASCCLRVTDCRSLHQAFGEANLPASHLHIPRISEPVEQPWGLTEFALIDPDGNLLRCLSPSPGAATNDDANT